MTTLETAAKIIPVLLLFVTGFVLRKTRFLSPSTMTDLKKLVVNVALPALLFTAFLSLEPRRNEIVLALSIFAVCIVLLVGSRIADRAMKGRWGIRSYMMGGFEAGMLGYALFLSVFGAGELAVFASVDLGQVVFVFVVLMPLLQTRSERSTDPASGADTSVPAHGARLVLRRVVTSPVVWAIVGGLIAGAVGRRFSISPDPFSPVSGFLDILGGLTAPLIALVIGYELEFRGEVIGRALLFVLIRKAVLVGAAALVLWLVPGISGLTRFAVLTMLLLPPPYVVTLAARPDEQALTAGILSTSTVVSVLAFALAVFVTGGVV